MKRHLIWTIEIIVWILIITALAGTFIFYNNHTKEHSTYQIFLPDVDGLINGSPVKYMGIQIGHVNRINIIEDKVFVSFVITEKGIKLPKGVHATVEFYGLGGSKSLEIYPPDPKDNQNKKLIIEDPPKRIGDALDLLNKMFIDIADITYTISDFMHKINVIESPQNQMKEKVSPEFADKFLNVTNQWFDNSQKRLDNLKKNINGERYGRKFKRENRYEQSSAY